MTEVGVSYIAIYVPPYYLAHEDLARARGVSPEKYQLRPGKLQDVGPPQLGGRRDHGGQ